MIRSVLGLYHDQNLSQCFSVRTTVTNDGHDSTSLYNNHY